MDKELESAELEVTTLVNKIDDLKTEMAKVIVGQEEAIDQLIITFLAGGHALLEGVPGLAKTLIIRTLSEAIDLDFRRIQFTPDLMPSDILGTEILEEDHSTGKKFFKFNKGPIFSNILLADEINRTPPKTQAALLEAMQEFEVSYAGQTYPLARPFFILATQNPIEQSGTYPLPEAQLDRFLMYIQIDYPSEQEEEDILRSTTGAKRGKVNTVLTGTEIMRLKELVREVVIGDELIALVNSLVRSTRPKITKDQKVTEYVGWGAGPRAGQAIILTAKARALIKGRYAVTKDDLSSVLLPVMRHRVLVNFKGEAENVTSDDVIKSIMYTADLSLNGKR
ncbi:MAG: MoxR family ATPase [Bacteroidota bacterium]